LLPARFWGQRKRCPALAERVERVIAAAPALARGQVGISVMDLKGKTLSPEARQGIDKLVLE
jgi:hypothetical protein